MQMRNQPSPRTGKIDIIDRHTKKRLIVIDSNLLFTQASQHYMMLLIDLAEISDYYDVMLVCKKDRIEELQQFVEHWMLKADVREQFTDYEKILKEYNIMFCFTTMRMRDKFKEYYRVDCLSR